MLTPAQNPRGLARMIFTAFPPCCRYPSGVGKSAPDEAGNGNATLSGGVAAPEGQCARGGEPDSLLELDVANRDDPPFALLGDGPGHGPVHGVGADLAVMLLVPGLVEDVEDILALLLCHDHSHAA